MLLNDVVFSLSSMFAAGVWVLQVIFIKVCRSVIVCCSGTCNIFGSSCIEYCMPSSFIMLYMYVCIATTYYSHFMRCVVASQTKHAIV